MRTSTGALVGLSLLLMQVTAAHAQEAGLTTPSGQAQGGGGFRLSEGLFLRAGVTAEAGYDTNVFYNDDPSTTAGPGGTCQGKCSSAVLNVIPSLEFTNAGRDNKRPPFHFSLGLTLAYREYLTDDTEIKAQRAFNPSVGALLAYAAGPSSFSLSDQFTRVEEAPYQAGQNPIIRMNNQGSLQYGIAPGGGRIRTVATYTNTLDLFESTELDYADRMSHLFSVDGSWKWLPKTALFMQAGVGYVSYINDAADSQGKANSIPYQVTGGLRGLLTPKITVLLQAGFADAIYDGDVVNPSGISNRAAAATVTYAPLAHPAVGLGYSHTFADSAIVGNYYDLDAVSARVTQQIADFVLAGFSRWEYRRYHGFQGTDRTPVSRSDNIFQTGVQLDYFFQRWFYGGVGYSHYINRSDTSGITAQTDQGLDFTKHLFVARLGLKY